MDRELAGAVIQRWESGLPVAETTLYKAASALGVDPMAALIEARFYTALDSYMYEKRAMSQAEHIVFSVAAGLNPFVMEKTATAYGFSPEELVLEALRRQEWIPLIEKLANLSAVGGDPTVGAEPPMNMADPEQMAAMQEALGMTAPPQAGAAVQQMPQARGFKPSPTAPEQVPPDSAGNLDALLQEHQGVFGQQAQENGGMPPANMPQPAPPPPSPEERIQQVGPNLDPETVGRYAEQLARFEEGIQMQIADPKQMVKFVKELQKVDGKRIDQGIKAMGQQLEQEQAQELGVDGTPTIDGGMQGGQQVLAPKQDQGAPQEEAAPEGGPPQQEGPPQAMPEEEAAAAAAGPPQNGAPPQQKKPQQKGPPPQAVQSAAEKVAHAARVLARSHFPR